MQKIYSYKKKSLLFISNRADSSFWDKQWRNRLDVFNPLKLLSMSSFTVKITRKYLPIKSTILEGGCGIATHVLALHNNGYEVYGIDYATETVKKVNAVIPNIKVCVGDVRKLQFSDATFDGYWSIGVIEHFYNGFDQIAVEIKRVIKSGGYLFLTVPTMSLARRIKAYFKKYEIADELYDYSDNFYQYIYSEKFIVDYFEKIGFKSIKVKRLDGVKGFKDEFKLFNKILTKIYISEKIILKIIKKILDFFLCYSSNHISLFVFYKQ